MNSTPIYETILVCPITVTVSDNSQSIGRSLVCGVISIIQDKMSSFASPFEAIGAHLTSQLQKKSTPQDGNISLSQYIKTSKPFLR